MKNIWTKIFILVSALVGSLCIQAQENPVKWNVAKMSDPQVQNVYIIYVDIADNWYIYGFDNSGGPMPLDMTISNANDVKISPITVAEVHEDEIFGKVSVHEKYAIFECSFKPAEDENVLSISGQACNKKDGACMPIFEEINFNNINK